MKSLGKALAQWMVVVALLVLGAGTALAGKKEKAIEAYKEGVRLGNSGKLEEAVAKWTESVALYPKLATSYIKMGMAYEMMKRTPQAQACYDLAVKATKKPSAAALNSRGEFLVKYRVLDAALEDFAQAIKLGRKKKEKLPAYQNQIKILLQQEKLEDADKALKAAVKLDAKDEDIMFYKGYYLTKAKKEADAEKHFAAMEKAHPESGLAQYGFGVLYKQVGDKDKAKAAFAKGCELKNKASCKEKKSMSKSAF